MRRGINNYGAEARPAARARQLVAAFAAVALSLGLGLFAAVTPAQAAPNESFDWSVTTATSSSGVVAHNGGMATFTATCASGRTPITGGYVRESGLSDIRRLSEFTEFGSGQHYQVSVVDYNGGAGGDTIHAFATCVPLSYFSNSATKFGSFSVGADHLAAGSVACDPGWFALSADVTFSSTDETLLTSTPDLEFDGWYAKGWSGTVGSAMWVWVHCVPSGDLPGARVYETATDIGWGTSVSASCPTGLSPLVGGTYETGGDGGAITTMAQVWNNGYTSVAESTAGGSMLTNVICIPVNGPSVTVSGQAVPNPNSTSAQWTYTASDPAAAGDYGMTVTCTLSHDYGAGSVVDYQDQTCPGSPVQVDNLADGVYTLAVHALTGDGRYFGTADYVVIDTTGPTVTFNDPVNKVYATHAPTIPTTVNDPGAGTWTVDMKCAVDGGSLAACGDGHSPAPQYANYDGPQSLSLSGIGDGSHVLHVTATDNSGNAASYQIAFRVDTTAPTVTQTGPTARFTLGTTVTVTWSGHDAVSGIAGYGVQSERANYNAGFGPWSATVAAGTSPRSFSSLRRGYTYCFHVRATDKVGNVSHWTTARCTAIPLDDRDLARSSGWTAVSPAGYFQHTASVSTKLGATLSVTGAQLRRVAVAATVCPTCGVVGVYLGNTRIATIDLHATSGGRKLFTLPAFSLRTATVTLRVLSTGKPVQIDALGLSRA